MLNGIITSGSSSVFCRVKQNKKYIQNRFTEIILVFDTVFARCFGSKLQRLTKNYHQKKPITPIGLLLVFNFLGLNKL